MIPKYRAWDSAKKEMFKDTFAITESGQVVVVEQESVASSPDYVFVERLVIMQSTGLKDKNGKEIFEGDILKFNDEWNEYCHEGYVDGSVEGVNYVEVVKGEACFEFGKTRYPESSLFIYMEDEHLSFAELVKDKDFEFEIIGNIYKNPELLEDKE
jgi:uncharacterized phage protein (TIGR01671 family)|nr:MAG TPA_asm: YopX protein [Caudoviricetes sp.]